MPLIKQTHIQQNCFKPTIKIINVLWNKLNYTLGEYQDTELIGVTWINDFQFIINIEQFSNYINIKKDVLIDELNKCGFIKLGLPSQETFDDLEITPLKEWVLYMKDGFTPNSEEDFINQISYQN